jgi:hypothetical protein
MPKKLRSRLQAMAGCEGLLQIPEGVSQFAAGSEVRVQILPFVTEDWDVCHI